MSQDNDEVANDDVDHDNTTATKLDTINYQHVYQSKIRRP